jgi:hypothetical protein
MRTITLELKTIGEWIEENKLDEANLSVTWTNPPRCNHTWGESFDCQDEFDLNTELDYWEGDDGYFSAEVYGRNDVLLEWNRDNHLDEVETFCERVIQNTPSAKEKFYKIEDDLYILMEDYEILKHHGYFDLWVEHNTGLTDD